MATDNVQNSAAANLQARQLLLATAFPFVRKLGTFGPFSPGQSTQIQLDRVGIFTHIALDVSASVNITTATTQSDVGPYNLLQNVQYSDFNTVKRVNTSGHLLYALQCVRRRRLSNEAYAAQTVAGLGQVDTNLQFPTAVGAGTIAFRLDVPLAYRPDTDLRGAILAQTVVGDHLLNLTFANSAVATDGTQAPYTAGAATISNIYVTVYEHYLQPQSLTQLPQIDLSTIYGIEGNYISSDNIAANQSKFINYPNNRSVLSSMHYFNNGGSGVANGADLSGITLIANANTNLQQYTPRYLRYRMRDMLGGDLPKGLYVLETRDLPISTYVYGNVQLKFDIASVNAAPVNFQSQYEEFYLAGSVLPGVAVGY